MESELDLINWIGIMVVNMGRDTRGKWQVLHTTNPAKMCLLNTITLCKEIRIVSGPEWAAA
jgi:hypothetical protein